MFLHTVLFWLRDNLTQAEKDQFEKGLAELTTIGTEIRFSNFILKWAPLSRL
jgi:hypothetical protein